MRKSKKRIFVSFFYFRAATYVFLFMLPLFRTVLYSKFVKISKVCSFFFFKSRCQVGVAILRKLFLQTGIISIVCRHPKGLSANKVIKLCLAQNTISESIDFGNIFILKLEGVCEGSKVKKFRACIIFKKYLHFYSFQLQVK